MRQQVSMGIVRCPWRDAQNLASKKARVYLLVAQEGLGVRVQDLGFRT